jgi:hypothetical protein
MVGYVGWVLWCLVLVVTLHSGSADKSLVKPHVSVGRTLNQVVSVERPHSDQTNELLQRIETAMDEEELYDIAEDIPAIHRSVDKAMKIVIAKDEDGIYAAYAIQRLASIVTKLKKKIDVKDRRFEQLTECVEIKVNKLRTVDLARCLWGLTVLGVNDKQKIDTILNEYLNRLDSYYAQLNQNTQIPSNRTSLVETSESVIDKLSTMLWTLGCVKDTFSWTNDKLFYGLSDALNVASVNRKFNTISTRLIVRVLWSITVHGVYNHDLFAQGLSEIIKRPIEELSTTNAVILLWSISQFLHNETKVKFDTSLLISFIDRISTIFDHTKMNANDIAIVAEAIEQIHNTCGDNRELSQTLANCTTLIIQKSTKLCLSSSSAAYADVVSILCTIIRLGRRTSSPYLYDKWLNDMMSIANNVFNDEKSLGDLEVVQGIKANDSMLLLDYICDRIKHDNVSLQHDSIAVNVNVHRVVGHLVIITALIGGESYRKLLNDTLLPLAPYNYSLPIALAGDMSQDTNKKYLGMLSNGTRSIDSDNKGNVQPEHTTTGIPVFTKKLFDFLSHKSVPAGIDKANLEASSYTSRLLLINFLWEMQNDANFNDYKLNICKGIVSDWLGNYQAISGQKRDGVNMDEIVLVSNYLYVIICMKWISEDVIKLIDKISFSLKNSSPSSSSTSISSYAFNVGCFEELVLRYKLLCSSSFKLHSKSDSRKNNISRLFGFPFSR